MWRKLLFRERRMWRVLRIIILPIYKNGELCDGEFSHGEFSHGELCEFSEFSHGEFSELCYGEFCEFCECCETYVSYVLMSKKTAAGVNMNLCLKKTAGGEEENGLMFLCLKKRWRELRKICVTLRSLLLAIVTHQVYKKMRLW